MKKRLISFIENFLETYAVIVLIFTVLTAALGKESGNVSKLFLLGSEGIAIKTLVQLFAFTFVICFLKLIFITDAVFKKMETAVRIVLFFILTGVSLAIFALYFKWTTNVPQYWLLVFVSYIVSSVVSFFIWNMLYKKEDEKLNNALEAMKSRNKSAE